MNVSFYTLSFKMDTAWMRTYMHVGPRSADTTSLNYEQKLFFLKAEILNVLQT